MKRITTRLVSAAAAFLFAAQTNTAAFAESIDVNRPSVSGTGQVNVIISPALYLQSNVYFTAELTGSGAQTVALDTDRDGEVCFTDLSAGDYTLKVSADGFADYVQNISVEQQAVTVRLMTDFVKGIDYDKNVHPGTLLIGDVNNDGVIDDKDKQQLTDAIDSGERGNVTDLNGDGSIDLADLEYLAKGYNIDPIQATTELVIPSSVIVPSAGAGTNVDGDLDSLLVRDGTTKLSVSGGGEISDQSPVVLQFDITKKDKAALADGIVIKASEENPISKAEVNIDYIDANGAEDTLTVPIEYGVHHLLNSGEVTAQRDQYGNIYINLGSQIAVKRVTFVIYGMTKNNTLAEISYVEFVNGMESRIPEPATDIPENLKAQAEDKSFVLTWDRCVNVTGYEVMITQGEVSETKRVTGCSLSVSSLNDKKLVNGTEYTVKVQSVNGTWKSGYGSEITVTPKASSKPDKPDGLTATGAYKSIQLSWKAAEDAEWYNVYYKLRAEDEYHKIANIDSTSYTVTELEDKAEYVVYVTAENIHGESAPSLTASAVTTDINPPVMPKYKLINTGGYGEIGQHIISASQNYGTMVGSTVEENERTAWGTVDHNPASFYQRTTWDDGGFNNLNRHGLFYEFDEEYTIQTFALHESTPINPSLSYTKINYWDAQGNLTALGYNQVSTIKKTDSEGRAYYLIRLPEKAQIKKIQIGLARYVASGSINVSEVYFYYYDTIIDDIANLYEDDLHLVLRTDVTQETIDELRKRLNTPDEVSGELNPDIELLERELKNAEDILNCKNLGAPVYIHSTISTKDVGRGFGGLNAWQPIGVTAAAGDTLTVYVGHNTKKTGDTTNLQLVATQYHAESGAMSKAVANLKVGSNTIDIPKIWSIDEESGGALYIQYTGNNENDRYAVRVSGGVKVPILDLYGIEDESQKLELAETYITELQDYVGQMEQLHAQYHADSSNANVNKYEYNAKNCILGASDILLDNMLLSLPAAQILTGSGQGSTAARAAQVIESAQAMEDMLHLFYQHKGLNDNAENEIDRLSNQHLNIRYQRMFSKAFMYAAGNHIGIEWNECSGMISASPLVYDEDGKYVSGHYFGWGIAHEIGHCINQSAYTVAEITNNYFAQLAQAKDTSTGMRFTYENIYDKVTSGTTGQASNIATQLGMYWQLHLAYDMNYNYKTFDDHAQQLESLFYARVDSYARTPSLAPAPDGISLTLSGGTDQCLMRLACAAAEKDILEFFERWGKIPDSTTIEYASQFEKEERAIYYTDDDSRVYRIENPEGGYLGTNGDIIAVGSGTAAVAAADNSHQVNFTLTSENIPEDEILGYEIVRCTTSGGIVSKQAVGFTANSTFTDYAEGLSNRVVTYEVIVVDKYLYRSAPMTLEPIKIQDDGSLDKTWWTISASGITPNNIPDPGTGDDDMPCEPEADDPVIFAADNDTTTEYIGTLSADCEIIISFNKQETVSGFRYIEGSGADHVNYTVMVKVDDGTWVEAASGVSGGEKLYFENTDGGYVATYKTDAVKLIISGQSGQRISIAELDVLGVTGDNVDFISTSDSSPVIGRLSDDYRYGSGENDIIPKNSVVFTGSYKGNPAYNVVMLFDENGNVVGGIDSEGRLTANQIILAEDPGSGLLHDVWNGTWIYWIEPDTADLEGLSKVRAELYRVNDALTNEGERLVSDSLFEDFPEILPEISFASTNQGGN